jgi:hypothetical protein
MIEENDNYCPDPDSAYEEQFELEAEPNEEDPELHKCIGCGNDVYWVNESSLCEDCMDTLDYEDADPIE